MKDQCDGTPPQIRSDALRDAVDLSRVGGAEGLRTQPNRGSLAVVIGKFDSFLRRRVANEKILLTPAGVVAHIADQHAHAVSVACVSSNIDEKRQILTV